MSEHIVTTRFERTTAIGGGGGSPFEFGIPGQLVKRIEVAVAEEVDRLRGLQVTLTDGKQETFGVLSGPGKRNTLELALGEKVDQLTVWGSDYKGGRAAGLKIKTNRGREFSIGQQAGSGSNLSAGYLGGVYGRCGSDIDALGFLINNEVCDYYLKDVKYDVVKADSGAVVPRDLDTGLLINSTSSAKNMGYSKMVNITQTKSWSSQFSVKAGIKVSGSAGVPLVAEGEVEVGLELGFSYTWGGSESYTSGQSINAGPIDVEPGKMYRIVARADSGNLIVPYTGTAVLTYENGQSIEQQESGVFKGVTVSRVQVQVTGPFDADQKLLALGTGQHEVVVDKAKFPHLKTQTVMINTPIGVAARR